MWFLWVGTRWDPSRSSDMVPQLYRSVRCRPEPPITPRWTSGPRFPFHAPPCCGSHGAHGPGRLLRVVSGVAVHVDRLHQAERDAGRDDRGTAL